MHPHHAQSIEPDSLRARISATLNKKHASVLLSDGHNVWTGREIEQKISILKALIERTTADGDYVGISFPNSATKGLLILAVMSSGRIPVLISFSDLSTSPSLWLETTPISLLLTANNTFTSKAHSFPVAVLAKDATLESYLDRAALTASCGDAATPLPKAGTGLVLFTSGSTGKPKGVLVPEEGLLRTIDFLTDYFQLNEATVAPMVLPVCHSMALNTQFLPTFFAGGRSHFVQSDMSYHRVYRSILEQRGTFVAMISAVLGVCWQEKTRLALEPATQVEHVQLAGGTITARHLQMAAELFPNAIIHKGYGLTEAIRVTMISSRDPNFMTETVGDPLPFLSIDVRPLDGETVSAETPGEVHVKGASVLGGLIDGSLARLTNDGYLPTGDLGYWNDRGQLCVIGRADDLMKINGNRVSSYDIEHRALAASTTILAAKCFSIEDTPRTGQKMVLVLEIPSIERMLDGRDFQELQLLLWEQFRILRYRPREILVVEKLPRTSNGKVALQQLRKLATESQRHTRIENSYSKTAFYFIPTQAQVKTPVAEMIGDQPFSEGLYI